MKKLCYVFSMHYTHHQNLGPAIKVSIFVSSVGIQNVQLALDETPGMKWTVVGNARYNEEIHHWLTLYAQGVDPSFTPPLDFPKATLFTQKVWNLMIEVPFGSSTTYGALAIRLGHSKAFRAVGSSCGKNSHPLFVPCHRVLGADSKLGGFSCGLEIKRRLLSFEKISFKSDLRLKS
ncbi:Methylated-DNA--protein-cysteine methyltransferase [Chlamydiales bacterium STE3]|nr:Methylated-DNA--protein-cysteine methyltransferase [Chlamydiales bacterium STE3]